MPGQLTVEVTSFTPMSASMARWTSGTQFPISGTLPRTGSSRMVSFPTVYQRVIAHKRFITFSLIFAFCVYPLIDLGKFGPTRVAFRVILVMFIASQFFWIRHALDLGERFIPGKPRRVWLTAIACFVELFFFVYSYTHMGGVVHLFLASKIIGAADPRLRSVSDGRSSLVVACRVGAGLRPGDYFLVRGPSGERCSVGLPQSACACGRQH